MKVVLDVLGSPAQSGGMRLHSTQIVNTWRDQFPDDELHVVGPRWAVDAFAKSEITVHYRRNESVIHRAPGQIFGTASVARSIRADAVISLSPIVTPFGGRIPRIAFQHDWRHRKNPKEFRAHQRLFRLLWSASAKWATFNACISTKARDETERYAPGSRTVLTPNGVDHAKDWPKSNVRSQESAPYVVTFGHHNNKRPELLIDALGLVDCSTLRLVVLGAQGKYRQALRVLATRRGVAERVSFPGFVSDGEYKKWVSGASVVALVSSDEGFGLPIAEAWWLGIPALVTADSNVAALFDGYPIESAPTPEDLARGVEEALRFAGDPSKARDAPTWGATVTKLRWAVVSRGR